MDSEAKICPFCEGIFGFSEIKDHIGIEHLGLQSGAFIEEEEASQFQCEVCSASFISEISLQRHVKFSHSEEVEKCGEKTIDKEGNIAKSTLKGERLDCPKCSKTFTKRNNLRAHMKAIHEGIKLTCPKCEKSFTQGYNLRCHMKAIHDGIKLKCSKCDKSFGYKNNLKIHMKRMHKIV